MQINTAPVVSFHVSLLRRRYYDIDLISDSHYNERAEKLYRDAAICWRHRPAPSVRHGVRLSKFCHGGIYLPHCRALLHIFAHLFSYSFAYGGICALTDGAIFSLQGAYFRYDSVHAMRDERVAARARRQSSRHFPILWLSPPPSRSRLATTSWYGHGTYGRYSLFIYHAPYFA